MFLWILERIVHNQVYESLKATKALFDTVSNATLTEKLKKYGIRDAITSGMHLICNHILKIENSNVPQMALSRG